MFKKFLFSVVALCCFMFGATKAADISTIEKDYAPNGATFTYDFTIDWTTHKLVVVMDVSNCKGTTLSSGNYSPENLFSVRGTSETTVDNGMHVWFDKNGDKKFYIQEGWGWNGAKGIKVTTVNDYHNVTLVFTKAAGISVNGTATNGTTGGANYLDQLNTQNFFTNYSDSYKFESQQGKGRSHAIYKSVKVVPLNAESNAIAYNESGKTSATLLQSGVANATEKNTTVNLSNQIFRVVMNLDNCVAKTDGHNYNLLNLSAGETSGAYNSGSTGNGVVHVYYQKQERKNHRNNVDGTTTTFSNGVLWFDIATSSNTSYYGASPIEITGGDVTIELRSDGIYVNGERKLVASGASYSSLVSNLFTAESHKVYYGNNENSANQASAAEYKEISIVPFVTATKLLQGDNNNETLSSLLYAGNKNIVIDRTFVSTDWNTLCLPFALTNAKLKAALGNDVKVCKLGSVADNVVSFVDCSSEDITAGKPYFVKPANTVSNPSFTDVQITTLLPSVDGNEGEIQFAGTLNPIALKTDGTNLFIVTGGKFQRPLATANTMKGFRAYLIVPAGTEANKLSSRFGGVETAIVETFVDAVKTADNRVFNLQGQMVGTSLNGLPAGLYIQNGKKVLVRK